MHFFFIKKRKMICKLSYFCHLFEHQVLKSRTKLSPYFFSRESTIVLTKEVVCRIIWTILDILIELSFLPKISFQKNSIKKIEIFCKISSSINLKMLFINLFLIYFWWNQKNKLFHITISYFLQSLSDLIDQMAINQWMSHFDDLWN